MRLCCPYMVVALEHFACCKVEKGAGEAVAAAEAGEAAGAVAGEAVAAAEAGEAAGAVALRLERLLGLWLEERHSGWRVVGGCGLCVGDAGVDNVKIAIFYSF